MRIPTCNGCGEQHYNFQPCVKRDEARTPPAKLDVIWRPSPGLVPFGDRLANYENRGGNLHLLPRKDTPNEPEAA